MAGGKKKAARQKQRNKYGNYRDRGHREKNKARRIVASILSSANPGETAGKVLDRYADGKQASKHAKAESVIANVKSALNKRNVTIVKPEWPKED